MNWTEFWRKCLWPNWSISQHLLWGTGENWKSLVRKADDVGEFQIRLCPSTSLEPYHTTTLTSVCSVVYVWVSISSVSCFQARTQQMIIWKGWWMRHQAQSISLCSLHCLGNDCRVRILKMLSRMRLVALMKKIKVWSMRRGCESFWHLWATDSLMRRYDKLLWL